jgi:hypothetical protein
MKCDSVERQRIWYLDLQQYERSSYGNACVSLGSRWVMPIQKSSTCEQTRGVRELHSCPTSPRQIIHIPGIASMENPLYGPTRSTPSKNMHAQLGCFSNAATWPNGHWQRCHRRDQIAVMQSPPGKALGPERRILQAMLGHCQDSRLMW